MLRTQVLVAGAGPAGSIAARFLAGEGIDTLLIDRDFSFIKPCGGGIPSAAFEELGLPAHPAEKYVDSIKIVSPSGEDINIKLKGGTIAIARRGIFDAALRHEAGNAGARLLEAEFRRFTDVGSTITAEAAAGGRDITVKADYVVAADGVNSRIRSALGIKPVSSFLTISEKIKGVDADSCEFWFGSKHAPQVYSWVFPQQGSISAGTGSFNSRDIRNQWQRFVERRRLGHANESLRAYKIPLWQGDLYNKGRVLFAGDSAGQVMPLSYEGIYYAMKSGEFAARAIISGKTGDYRKLWEKRFRNRFALMRRLWEYFLKDDSRADKLVQLHKRPEVQDASMRLWLSKDPYRGSLLSYINLFRKAII